MNYDEAVKAIEGVNWQLKERQVQRILDAIGFRQMQEKLDRKQERIEQLRGGELERCEKGFRAALERVDRVAAERDAARVLADQLHDILELEIATNHTSCTHNPCTPRTHRPIYEERGWK